MSYFGLMALILAHFLMTAAPAYLVLIFSLVSKTSVKLPLRIVLYLCAWICYWLAIFSYGISTAVLTHILFYSGFLLPWVIIHNNKWIGVFVNEKFITGLCLLTILEAVLFNSPIGEHLYFFPIEGSERTKYLGIYQRPAGLAGNASMTSGVLFFLVVLNDRIRGAIKSSTKFLVLVTTIVLASGTGFGLFLAYLLINIFRSNRLNLKAFVRGVVYLLMLVIGFAVALGFMGEFQGFNKFSVDYFAYVLDVKGDTIQESTKWMMENRNLGTVLLGEQIRSDVPITSGDFGFLITARAIGLMGASLLFMVPFLYPGAIRRNIVPTLFFYFSFIHYPGLLSPPGQVLLACYLCLLARSKHKPTESPSSRRKNMALGERA